MLFGMCSVDGPGSSGTDRFGNDFAGLYDGLEMSSGGLGRFPVDMMSCHAVL